MNDPDKMVSLLKTLPLHSRFVLCACIRLLASDNDAKITVMEVFTEYKRLTARFNVNWLSVSKVTEHIKELEMYGFLKCTYPPKGHAHQIKHIHMFGPDEIPKYLSVLQEEDLRKENVVPGHPDSSVSTPY